MKYYGSLEAGGTKMVCAIGDEQGNILERISIPTLEPENTMPAIIDFFKNKNISALGIGCFGPVDLDRKSATYGYITTTPKLPWKNYDIVGVCEKELGVPVGFDTEVNASALGEATWGCTKDLSNSIYITVGTGIGVGVIIDRKPYHGMLHPEGGGVSHQEQMLPMIRKEVERQMGGYIQAKGMKDLDHYIVLPSLNDNQGIMGGLKLAMDAE